MDAHIHTQATKKLFQTTFLLFLMYQTSSCIVKN